MRAFTLVETLVAVSILALSITAPLYTASRGITAAENASYQLSASYLAQEGVEYLRMVRDNSYLAEYALGNPTTSADAWSAFKVATQKCTAPNSCTLDPTTALPNSLIQCVDGICTQPYLYRSTTGVYSLITAGTKKQPFMRSIQITMPSPTEIQIVSTVKWFFHSTTYSVDVTEILTPWQ